MTDIHSSLRPAGSPNFESAERTETGSASSMGKKAADKAKSAAAEVGSSLLSEANVLLSKQTTGRAAASLGTFRKSLGAAARDLESGAPWLSGYVNKFAEQVEGYERDLRDMPIEDVFRKASAIAREKPALIFGLTAVLGFIITRTIKAAPESGARTPRSQPHSTPTDVQSFQSFDKPAQF